MLTLVACVNDDMRDLRGFVDEVKARPAGRIPPLPEIKQIETFAYTASDQRNPFLPEEGVQEESAQDLPDDGVRPDLLRRKEELEAFPLDSIRMVGTLEQQSTVWGLLQSKDGTIYRVRPGNYVGQNHGQITNIQEDRIELTEIVPDGRGRYMERQASLALSE
jgi:type IV pilus assembly protein PilP